MSVHAINIAKAICIMAGIHDMYIYQNLIVNKAKQSLRFLKLSTKKGRSHSGNCRRL